VRAWAKTQNGVEGKQMKVYLTTGFVNDSPQVGGYMNLSDAKADLREVYGKKVRMSGRIFAVELPDDCCEPLPVKVEEAKAGEIKP
jgi:hypothetical protein